MTRESTIESEDATVAARRESDNAGDVYYNAITAWMVSRMANGSSSKCLELAIAYDLAIDRLIDRLKQQVISAASKRSISIATRQKSLLKSDLDYLEKESIHMPAGQHAEPCSKNEEVGRFAQSA